jgi:DinB superfamily
MTKVQNLIEAVANSRKNYLNTISQFSEEVAQAKPDAFVWNAVENTEHLFWAEQGALFGMWKVLDALKNGDNSSQSQEAPMRGLPIEEIIEKTWQEKEVVPAVAAPRMVGTLAFWAASLNSLQSVLEKLGNELTDNELNKLTHPHPISGVLDFGQRLEFLRFHIDRHNQQVLKLKL